MISVASRLSRVKAALPWWAKIAAKLLLSRIPLPYSLWKRLSLFEQGAMERPEYAYQVFRRHFDRAGAHFDIENFVALELGPGDTLYSALIARAFGAANIHLVDDGDFATRNLDRYDAMDRYLSQQGRPIAITRPLSSLESLLTDCGATYHSGGLASLRAIADGSVDFIWSQAVLEHIRKTDFLETLRQMRRVLGTQGVCSHRIDLTDHLGGGLNNLRFSDRTWESAFFSSSGFYTNRIRYSEMLRLFDDAGFEVEICGIDRWPSLPVARRSLAPAFKDLPEEDLRVLGFDVILRPASTEIPTL